MLIVRGAGEMSEPLARLQAAPVTLDPARLPEYALRTTLRMFAALGASLLFTFTVATLVAKSRKAELVIVPALDILQSVPVALVLVLEGHSRAEAARSCGMDRQTLRDWVHRYNAAGLAGLVDRHAGGAERKLTSAQEAMVAEWVRQGPRIEEHGVVRWRRVDLRDEISKAFDVHLHERSVGKLLHRLGFRRISVRPRHPRADAAAQQAHKKTSPNSSPAPSPRRPEASRSSSAGRTRPASASKAA